MSQKFVTEMNVCIEAWVFVTSFPLRISFRHARFIANYGSPFVRIGEYILPAAEGLRLRHQGSELGCGSVGTRQGMGLRSAGHISGEMCKMMTGVNMESVRGRQSHRFNGKDTDVLCGRVTA